MNNKTYRLVWNRRSNTVQVAPEFAASHAQGKQAATSSRSASSSQMAFRPNSVARALFMAFLSIGAVAPAFAVIVPQALTVTSSADSGAGTLRQAILDANGAPGSTITIDPSVTSITPSSALPAFSAPVTISASGPLTVGSQTLDATIPVTLSGMGQLTADVAFAVPMAGTTGIVGADSVMPLGTGGTGGVGGAGSDSLSGTNFFLAVSSGTIQGGSGGIGGAGGMGGSGKYANGGSGGVGGTGGVGGAGVSGTGFGLTNNGTITGGAGGTGGQGGSGGVGGAPIRIAGPTVPTNGFNGGTGGSGGLGGAGGAGVSGSGFALTNNGTISGGVGGLAGTGGSGGNGSLGKYGGAAGSNGSAGSAGAGGAGGVGIVSTGNATINNAGTISGGLGNGGAGAMANAIAFSGGNNKLVIEAGSVINGDVVSGGGDTLALGGTVNGLGGNSFSLADIGNAAQFQGFANFSKEDTSIWTLTGVGTSDWNVVAGTLGLADAASLTGSITVLGGASLAPGNASVSGSVGNAGTLTVGAGKTFNIGGNFTNSGSFSPTVASMASFGTLNVTGAANLGGSLDVDASSAAGLASGTLSSIIHAGGGINGTFASVTDNSLLFNFAATYRANDVDLTIAAAGGSSTVLSSVNAMGNSPAQGAAHVLDQTISSAPGGSLALLFAPLTTQQQVSDAVTQVLPLFTGGTTTVIRGALSSISQIVESRQNVNRGLSSGDAFTGDKNFWMKPFASHADQDDHDGVAGFKAKTYGIVFGMDGTLSPILRAGVAFAYAKSDIDGKSAIAPQAADVNVYQLVGYGAYSFDERTNLDFQVDVGRNANSGRRQIAFTSSTASSNYDSHTAHVGATLGRNYALSGQTTLTPSVRADYLRIKDRAYSETGAGALNLSVDSRSTEALVLGVDSKLSHLLNEQTTLVANLGVGYDTLNKRHSITAAFAGAPNAAFVTYGMKPSPWLGRGGVGAVYMTKSGLEITGRYDVEFRERFLNQTASANLRWAF